MRTRILMEKTITIALCFAIVLSLASAQGCKKPEPARIIFAVEGELFSDALVFLDGNQAGKLTQTLITADGKLYIDGILNVTLPPGHRDIPEEDDYTGSLDSFELKPGEHIIMLQTDEGKTLRIKANVTPGRHLVTYLGDEQVLRWNDVKLQAAPGTTVTVQTTGST